MTIGNKSWTMFILLVLLVACSKSNQDNIRINESEIVPEEIQPEEVADTAVPTDIPTEIPTATPLPGKVVYSIDNMSDSIPWLPANSDGAPGTLVFEFNTHNPPFDNLLVRKAFAAAIDREAMVERAKQLKFTKVTPATTFLSPLILGQDLYGEVGISYDPEMAREFLYEAGYEDPSLFPTVTLMSNYSGGETPGAFVQIARAVIEMWEENLGVSAELKIIENTNEYFDFLLDHTNEVSIYRVYWYFDGEGLDPSEGLNIYTAGNEDNIANFENADYDQLVENGNQAKHPSERQNYYIQAERVLCEEYVAIIPILHAVE